MSREIEFRAWDKLVQHYWYLDKETFVFKCSKYKNGSHVMRISAALAFDNTERFVIEQYTNLKDKNGKEVYEGDIDLVSEGMYGVIIWKKGGFWIKWPGRYKPFEEFLTPEMDGQLDIVGDIHNNLELLEVGK